MNLNTNTQTDSLVDNKEDMIKKYCDSVADIINQDINGYKNAWNFHLINECKDRNVVYFIENTKTHKIKIGKTTNIVKRMKELWRCGLQVGMPLPLLRCRFLICCSDRKECSAIEKALHRHFANRRCIGEWFNLSANEIKFFLDECYGSPLLINEIPMYCGFLDVTDLKLPMVIGYDYEKFIDFMNYISTHPFSEYKIAIKREYGLFPTELINVYCKYKNQRLDDFIIDFYAPSISQLNIKAKRGEI